MLTRGGCARWTPRRRQVRPPKNAPSARNCARRCWQHVLGVNTRPPPPTRESPPRSSKSAACASIASQLWRTPHQEHDGFVPVATVVKDLCRHNLVGCKSVAVGHAADPSRRPAYLPRSSIFDNLVFYAEQGNPLALDALKSPTAANETDGVPSDFNKPTDAEVGKWSFSSIIWMGRKSLTLISRRLSW